MSSQPAQYIELLGQLSDMAIIYAIFKAIPNEIIVDIYKMVRQKFYRTPEEKLDLENKKADLLKKVAIINRSSRVDYFKTVLLLRQEGFLTNKLNNKELASLLEIIIAKSTQNHESMSKVIADLEVDINDMGKKEGMKIN